MAEHPHKEFSRNSGERRRPQWTLRRDRVNWCPGRPGWVRFEDHDGTPREALREQVRIWAPVSARAWVAQADAVLADTLPRLLARALRDGRDGLDTVPLLRAAQADVRALRRVRWAEFEPPGTYAPTRSNPPADRYVRTHRDRRREDRPPPHGEAAGAARPGSTRVADGLRPARPTTYATRMRACCCTRAAA